MTRSEKRPPRVCHAPVPPGLTHEPSALEAVGRRLDLDPPGIEPLAQFFEDPAPWYFQNAGFTGIAIVITLTP